MSRPNTTYLLKKKHLAVINLSGGYLHSNAASDHRRSPRHRIGFRNIYGLD